MDKEITILGKFYLKSGHVVEERVILDKENNRGGIDAFIKEAKDTIKMAFREDINFQFTFGFTTFRGSEIAAVTIEEQQ